MPKDLFDAIFYCIGNNEFGSFTIHLSDPENNEFNTNFSKFLHFTLPLTPSAYRGMNLDLNSIGFANIHQSKPENFTNPFTSWHFILHLQLYSRHRYLENPDIAALREIEE